MKKELSQLKEENASTRAQSEYVSSEINSLTDSLKEYEHKLILSQATIDSLQQQNQQDRRELGQHQQQVVL